MQGFPWPVPGLPVALIECEHGHEELADAALDTYTASKGAKTFRNAEEANMAIRWACRCLLGHVAVAKLLCLALIASDCCLQGHVNAAQS